MRKTGVERRFVTRIYHKTVLTVIFKEAKITVKRAKGDVIPVIRIRFACQLSEMETDLLAKWYQEI